MEIQPQLVLLEKTLLNIEGLGRMLYPELDLWTTAKPYMERWMKDQVGIKGLFDRTKRNIYSVADQTPELPLIAYRILMAYDKRLRTIEPVNKPTTQPASAPVLSQIISGATLLICGTLVLLFGPGQWCQKQQEWR
ncbi:hypothetical protein [Chromatium okenii]|uniref:hypothetical protein n=1 Tax=Chromatium okenii TaxID=61644 RepID=UPI001F5BBC0D|nr:hypothetical protein [Chromatium okenii]